MATRLAHARAHLRLEFLLAFRRVKLSSDRCRAVLLSLSNGDRRRQAMLDAPAHLAACPTCADLAEPLMRRNRRVLALLLLPCTDGYRRAWGRLTGMLVQRAAVVTMAGAALTLSVVPGTPIAEPAHATIQSEPADTIPFSLTPTPGTPGVPTPGAPACPRLAPGGPRPARPRAVPTVTVPSAPMSTVSFPPSTTATTAPPAPADAAPSPGTPTPCPLTTPVADLDAATDALCPVVTSVVSPVQEPVIAAPAPMLAPPPNIVSAVEETVGPLPATTLPPAPIHRRASAQEPVAAAPARVLPPRRSSPTRSKNRSLRCRWQRRSHRRRPNPAGSRHPWTPCSTQVLDRPS